MIGGAARGCRRDRRGPLGQCGSLRGAVDAVRTLVVRVRCETGEKCVAAPLAGGETQREPGAEPASGCVCGSGSPSLCGDDDGQRSQSGRSELFPDPKHNASRIESPEPRGC